MHPVRLNSAGRLAQSFIESKLTPLFVVAGFLLAIFSSLVTPREENPQIIVPAVQVTWLLPGATPEEVDRLVVVPMEAALREIDGVKHSSAAAAHGIGRVMVEFHVGQDEDRVLERVKQRVAVHRDRLPRATLDPRIEQIRVDDAPIVTLTLASQRYDDYALRRLAERIAERLNNIKEVSVTQIHGGRLRELRVNLDPARLQAHGLTLNEGIAAIGLKLPLFVPCLLVGILYSNLLPSKRSERAVFHWPRQSPSLDLIGELSLGIFLAMSLMSLQLWTLIGLALPLLVILLTQFIVALAVNLLLVFRLMGRTYDAAVICAGFGGIALGSTPTAMANMTAVTQQYGASRQAFLIVPLVSAFFLDLVNAILIPGFISQLQ